MTYSPTATCRNFTATPLDFSSTWETPLDVKAGVFGGFVRGYISHEGYSFKGWFRLLRRGGRAIFGHDFRAATATTTTIGFSGGIK